MKLKYYSGAQVTSIIEKLPSKEYLEMLNAFAKEPSAGVVEVVRCKDCAYKQYYFTNDMVKCGCGNGSHHEDFFCGDGERREE